MTLISWNGGPIFRNGAVGTEQACCCGGPPPFTCESCPDCEFPASQYEQGSTIDCFGTTSLASTRALDRWINNVPPGGLPAGVAWKDGFPNALNGCEWAFVIDSLSIDCCYENCDVEPPNPTFTLAAKTRNRYRILLLTCPDGPESAQITDITDQAIEGDLEFENDLKPDNCPGPPVACTDWFDYFPDPEPVCNEFP